MRGRFLDKAVSGVNDPPPEFPGKLRAAGLSQTEFRELVERLSGQRISQTTTSRWVKGMRKPPPCALALLALVARIPPADLERLLADAGAEGAGALAASLKRRSDDR